MRLFFFLITSLFILNIYAQVGIKTINPTEDFDINGTVRIREIPQALSTSTFSHDSILITNEDGKIYRIKSSSLFEKRFLNKVFIKAVKSTEQTITSNGGEKIITNWDTVTSDTSNATGWNASTGEYTVQKDGWYRVTTSITYQPQPTCLSGCTSYAEYNVSVRVNGIRRASKPNFAFKNQTGLPINTGTLQTLVQCSTGDKISVATFHNFGTDRKIWGSIYNPSLTQMFIEEAY